MAMQSYPGMDDDTPRIPLSLHPGYGYGKAHHRSNPCHYSINAKFLSCFDII